MSKTISILNYKGGVGKTAITLNLGAALAQRKKRILLVDFDPQAALTYALIGNETERIEGSILDLVLNYDVRPISIDNGLDLIPSTFELDSLEKKRVENNDLSRALKPFGDYDFILIDTPPAINVFSVLAAIAGRAVYVVVSADLLSIRSLIAIQDLVRGLETRTPLRIIVNLYDRRRNIEKDLFKMILRDYGDKAFRTPIRRSVLIPEGIALNRPVVHYRRTSAVARDFRELAAEVIRKELKK